MPTPYNAFIEQFHVTSGILIPGPQTLCRMKKISFRRLDLYKIPKGNKGKAKGSNAGAKGKRKANKRKRRKAKGAPTEGTRTATG